MENVEESKSAKPSMVSQIAVLGLSTLIALGGGWGFGTFVLGDKSSVASGSTDTEATADADGRNADNSGHGDTAADSAGKDMNTEGVEVEKIAAGEAVPLDPIVANLASPRDTWVRLELSVLFGSTPEIETVNAIHQDILAYVKTVKLHQVDGPSGYMHLKSDLRDLVEVRSGGEARDILIRALLFE